MSSNLKLPDSQAVHLRNQFGCYIKEGDCSLTPCLKKQLAVLPSPAPETDGEVHMPQTAHPENKITPEFLNLLMENLENCSNSYGERLHFPQVKGMLLTKPGKPRRVSTLCRGKHQHHQYRESKRELLISDDL